MNTCALTAVILFGFIGQANPAPGLDAVARLATEARDAAVTAMPRGKGQGRYEYTLKKSADGETTFERKGEYSFAFSEERNWGKFVKSLERDYEATVYVSDSKNLMVAYFDDEINHQSTQDFSRTGRTLKVVLTCVLFCEIVACLALAAWWLALIGHATAVT